MCLPSIQCTIIALKTEEQEDGKECWVPYRLSAGSYSCVHHGVSGHSEEDKSVPVPQHSYSPVQLTVCCIRVVVHAHMKTRTNIKAVSHHHQMSTGMLVEDDTRHSPISPGLCPVYISRLA